jgi:hypothetical protein
MRDQRTGTHVCEHGEILSVGNDGFTFGYCVTFELQSFTASNQSVCARKKKTSKGWSTSRATSLVVGHRACLPRGTASIKRRRLLPAIHFTRKTAVRSSNSPSAGAVERIRSFCSDRLDDEEVSPPYCC